MVLAQEGAETGGSGLPTLFLIGGVFLFMYLFLLKPGKQREQDEKAMLDKLKKNDHVVTKGGLHGVVMNVKDDEVVLKVDEQQNVKVRVQKTAIASVVGDTKAEDKKG